MTEQEWLTCTDPKPMLELLRGKVSERKLRLFACGYCRCLWRYITDRHIKGLIRLTEGYAETPENDLELRAVWRANFARGVVGWRGKRDSTETYLSVVKKAVVPSRAVDLEGLTPAAMLREVVLNPFRPSPPLPAAVLAWNGRTIPRLAQGIYEARKMPPRTLDTARLAVLADALLDGGCEDEGLIQHCRSEGPHVRGCWAVDLILGKS
jgi:hypothetical protein